MVDVVGATLGATSLAITLLDGAIKGFNFFLAVGNVDGELAELHARLEIEQYRILDFAHVAGLLDILQDHDLPGILQTQKLVLIACFTQISSKLDAFAGLTQYQQIQFQVQTAIQRDHLLTTGDPVAQSEFDEFDVGKQYSKLKIKWSKGAKARQHHRGLNHIHKYYTIGESIVKDPRRLKWTAWDKKTYGPLLDELRGYNDFLHGLLHGEYAKRLEERTNKSYLEILLVRNELDDLKRLTRNFVLLTARPGSQDANPPTLRAAVLPLLAELKIRSKSRGPIDGESISSAQGIGIDKLPNQSIDLEAPAPDDEDIIGLRKRSGGQFWQYGRSEAAIDVWIEWKAYTPTADGSPHQADTDRMRDLVTLLKTDSLHMLNVPKCLGYFDHDEREPGQGQGHVHGREHDDASSDKHNTHPTPLRRSLFGIVYEKPSRPPGLHKSSPNPVSLLEILESEPVPSLGARVALAQRLSSSLLYLNSASWFHKAFRSDAVVFHRDQATGQIDYAEPFITGFEYARPDSNVQRSTKVSESPASLMYVHPIYQQVTGAGDYSRTYDIYSLGIVLLEIAYWKPIVDVVRPEFPGLGREPSGQLARDLRAILLGKATGAQTEKGKGSNASGSARQNYLDGLRVTVGQKYHDATKGCIEGFIELKEDETSPEISIALQTSFIDVVVEGLGGIVT